MSKLLKIIPLIILNSQILLAQNIEEKIENFFKVSLAKNSILNFKIHANKTLNKPENWSAYFVTLEYQMHNRTISLKDVVFSDGEFICNDFLEIEKQNSHKKSFLKEWDKYVR